MLCTLRLLRLINILTFQVSLPYQTKMCKLIVKYASFNLEKKTHIERHKIVRVSKKTIISPDWVKIIFTPFILFCIDSQRHDRKGVQRAGARFSDNGHGLDSSPWSLQRTQTQYMGCNLGTRGHRHSYCLHSLGLHMFSRWKTDQKYNLRGSGTSVTKTEKLFNVTKGTVS